LEVRLDKCLQTLDTLRQQVEILKRDVHQQGTLNLVEGSLRRDEEGFRGIYMMNRDGSHVEFLTAAPGMISSADPQWSHDGKMIAFGAVSDIDQPVNGKNYVYALEGPYKGMTCDLGYGNTPAWSADDKQIAYMINNGNAINAKYGAWIMDADGTHRRWVASGWFPRFSPDGNQLVCHGYEGNKAGDLLLVDLKNETSRSLLAKQGWDLTLYGGNWAPDGKRIVFVGTFQGKDRLATIDVKDESIQILYTNDDPSVELYGPPVWSPDGHQIVFVKQEKTTGPRMWWKSYLYTISADSPAEPTLLEGKKVGNINRGATFSPDGSKILFSSER
jgi:Tol biopolymer transport system component